jgi:hypothetical protein
MSVQLPSCPATLKAIQHYLNTAAEHDQRDPVVSYWCKYFIESVVSDDDGVKMSCICSDEQICLFIDVIISRSIV